MTNDVRQVVERLRERHAEMCDETDGMESGDAEVLRLAADGLEKAEADLAAMQRRAEAAEADWQAAEAKLKASPSAPSGWQQRIAAMDPMVPRMDLDGRWVLRCFFCKAPTHTPACLWQNAKDAVPPSSSESAYDNCLEDAGCSCLKCTTNALPVKEAQ